VRSTRAYVVAIAVLMSLAIALQVWRDRGWTPYEPATPLVWLQDASWVRRASLGFDSIVADVYWIRAVVYFGQQRLSSRPDKNYDLLYPLLNLVTALDPRFLVAYRFGAIFLSEPPPGGPNRPDQAIALLERGAERMPERWELPHDIGFVHAWNTHNYEEAARWFDRASLVPGAPIWLKSTAASMLTRHGDRDSARQLWAQILQSADVDWIASTAKLHLAQFDALDAIDALNEAVWRYKATTGRMPRAWEELIAARVLRDVPRDPAGAPFELDQINEDVRVSHESPLWPMPEGYGASGK
jgi:hypothetical protein